MHEPEQGDDGELVAEIRDAQSQPKPLERRMAQWSANSSGSRHEPMILQSALVSTSESLTDRFGD